MREYGKVYTAFWQDPSMRALSEDARTLALYLLTCPHGNLIGLFRLPDAYVSDDLQWTMQRVSKGFAELFRKGFCQRDEGTNMLVIPKFVKWNAFENPNVAKNAAKVFDSAISGDAKAICASSLLKYGGTLPEPFRKALETLSNSVRKPEPEPEPEPLTPNGVMSGGAPDVVPLKTKKQEATEVLAFLNAKASRNYQPTDTNLDLILARLREGYTPAQCRQVIAKKTREWLPNDKMREYLRPATLFNREKFNQYVGELIVVEDGHGLHEAMP